MSENLVCISGVRGYEQSGVAYLHIEDVARGLGFTEKKDDVEYVMWRRVESHLQSLGFGTSAENENPHDYYIQTSEPLEKSRGFFFSRLMVLIEIHPPHLCYTRICQEDMRSKDLKTFSKKVAQPH